MNENIFLSILFFEMRMRISFFQSRVLRQEREQANYFSRWRKVELILKRIPGIENSR